MEAELYFIDGKLIGAQVVARTQQVLCRCRRNLLRDRARSGSRSGISATPAMARHRRTRIFQETRLVAQQRKRCSQAISSVFFAFYF